MKLDVGKAYRDERGEIIDIAEMDFKALQIIYSKKGSVRSNHYHKEGAHLLFVLSGKMRYLERRAASNDTIVESFIRAGDSVFTGPMMTHATEFLEDTVLICCATIRRSGDAYEQDLVREVLL